MYNAGMGIAIELSASQIAEFCQRHRIRKLALYDTMAAMMTTLHRQTQDILDTIITGYQPEKVVLFGSAARDAVDDGSDIDLLIVKQDSKNRLDRARDVYRLLGERSTYPIGVDVLVVTPQELAQRLAMNDPFFVDVMAHGKVLFTKS